MNDHEDDHDENYEEHALHRALGISDERIEQVQRILQENWTRDMNLNDVLQWTASTKLLTSEERVIVAYAAGLDRQDINNKENIERARHQDQEQEKEQEKEQDHGER